MDAFGDHVMTCRKHSKTTMHNTIRNGLQKLLQKTCMLVKLTSSDAMVEREPSEVIPELPRLRPFDISVLFNHMLDEGAWRSDLKMLGIGITIVPPTAKYAHFFFSHLPGCSHQRIISASERRGEEEVLS